MGGALLTGGQGSKVYVLCAEPKEHKRFRPGTRAGGIGFPARRIGDRGDREIVYVPNVYVPFPAPIHPPNLGGVWLFREKEAVQRKLFLDLTIQFKSISTSSYNYPGNIFIPSQRCQLFWGPASAFPPLVCLAKFSEAGWHLFACKKIRCQLKKSILLKNRPQHITSGNSVGTFF